MPQPEYASGAVATDERRTLARQHVLTGLLFGVDFVPIRRGNALTSADPAGTAPPAVEAPSKAGPGRDTGASDAAAKAAALAALLVAHDADCPHCRTATYHSRTVFGEGNSDADLMFIGEAPGEEEDRTGRPFVGRAGKKLDEIIGAMGLRREDVYIANILKSRPPNNRTPLQHEVEACAVYLAEQIRIIRPHVIVALGGPSTKFLLDTSTGITRLRGQWAEYQDLTAGLAIPVMPTFHPAYLLRNYTADTRRKVWSDMQMVLARLQEAAGSEAPGGSG
ncbi:MAG: uracil-DNA glycosylase [Planctomycetota bacterium]|jgi:DNA polymerase